MDVISAETITAGKRGTRTFVFGPDRMYGYALRDVAQTCAISLRSVVASDGAPFLRTVSFKPRVGTIEGAYLGLSGDLVMLREASLPDVCIVCGTPARGNVYRAEFEPYRYPLWHVPIFYDIPYWIVGKRYVVDFPFCSVCKPQDFGIRATRIDEKVGFFSGVSNTFLKSLPRIPQELAAGLQGTWAQRVLRSIMR